MTNELAAIETQNTALTLQEQAGQAANAAAGGVVFADYLARKAANTIRRQAGDLNLFADFLAGAGVMAGDLQADPNAWAGITWGLVKAFATWQLKAGYAIASINGRLSTVKVFAGLAAMVGVISPNEIVLIRSVKGYEHKEQKNVDEKRQAAGMDTRRGSKKAAAVQLTPNQALAMKSQPETPQGKRDNLLICLMANLGLRVGEVAALTIDNFDLDAGEMKFYRPKVGKTQTHKLDRVTLAAAMGYLPNHAPADGLIWRASVKGGELGNQGMTERAITKRVGYLANKAGVSGLSAHDLRHFWATQAARNGTALDRLQDAGGWSSLAMPGRYISAAAIANMGVKLE